MRREQVAIVTSRKAHLCYLCFRPIKIGTPKSLSKMGDQVITEHPACYERHLNNRLWFGESEAELSDNYDNHFGALSTRWPYRMLQPQDLYH